MIDATRTNGFHLQVTVATIEGFLAAYGDRSRYRGDTSTERRKDVVLAANRLRLLPSDSGGVQVVAICTDIRQELGLHGFLEVYERNSERVTTDHLRRLKSAVSIFVARDEQPNGQ